MKIYQELKKNQSVNNENIPIYQELKKKNQINFD